MIIKYNIDELEHIVSDLSCLTGISISFVDTDFNNIVLRCREQDYCSLLHKNEKNKKYCIMSDREILLKCKQSRKLESHTCHAGLCDSAMPIIKNGIIAGYIIFGRIRNQSSPQNQIYNNEPQKAEILNKKYQELTFLSQKQIDSFYDLLPRILFQNAIKIEDDEFISEISEYIKNHLSKNLTISFLCKNFFVSKNRLYEAFKNYYGCTVNSYITEQRIKKAKELLKNSSEPIYKVAETSGFYNYTYFCKIFKRKTGVNPSDYKKLVNSRYKKPNFPVIYNIE